MELLPIQTSRLERYKQHLPTMVLAVAFHFLLIYLIFNVAPDSLKDFVIANSYSPFLIIVCLSQFFLWSFLLLHSRRGLLMSFLLTAIVWLQLRELLQFYAVLIVTLPLLSIEVILTIFSHK